MQPGRPRHAVIVLWVRMRILPVRHLVKVVLLVPMPVHLDFLHVQVVQLGHTQVRQGCLYAAVAQSVSLLVA